MRQSPVSLFQCLIKQRHDCMGSRWLLSSTIEQSESRNSSSDFISGVSSSTKSGVDASSGPQRGTRLRVVAEVTNPLTLRISLEEEKRDHRTGRNASNFFLSVCFDHL